MLVPVVHALEPEALTSVASDVLLPKEYRANDRLIDPAPWLVAGNAMANAMSTSDSAMGAAITILAKYKELANCVPIVPVALVTGRATNCKGHCCVRLSRDIAAVSMIVTIGPPAPVERLIPAPATNAAAMVIVLAFDARLIPVPPTMDMLPVEAFMLKAGAEIVTLPAPTPTLAIPAPENTRPVLNVPVEFIVVFPDALKETATAAAVPPDMYSVLPLMPTLTFPAPETFSRLDIAPLLLTVVFPIASIVRYEVCTDADTVMVLPAPCPMPIPAPAEMDKIPLEPFKLWT